jgi:hypothetical protein
VSIVLEVDAGLQLCLGLHEFFDFVLNCEYRYDVDMCLIHHILTRVIMSTTLICSIFSCGSQCNAQICSDYSHYYNILQEGAQVARGLTGTSGDGFLPAEMGEVRSYGTLSPATLHHSFIKTNVPLNTQASQRSFDSKWSVFSEVNKPPFARLPILDSQKPPSINEIGARLLPQVQNASVATDSDDYLQKSVKVNILQVQIRDTEDETRAIEDKLQTASGVEREKIVARFKELKNLERSIVAGVGTMRDGIWRLRAC